VCYGKIFGYAGWMYGRVIDMFYFPLIRNASGEVLFFRPVFNFADSCITVAVFVIALFYLKDLNSTLENSKKKDSHSE
jgi:signal peptidase II